MLICVLFAAVSESIKSICMISIEKLLKDEIGPKKKERTFFWWNDPLNIFRQKGPPIFLFKTYNKKKKQTHNLHAYVHQEVEKYEEKKLYNFFM